MSKLHSERLTPVVQSHPHVGSPVLDKQDNLKRSASQRAPNIGSPRHLALHALAHSMAHEGYGYCPVPWLERPLPPQGRTCGAPAPQRPPHQTWLPKPLAHHSSPSSKGTTQRFRPHRHSSARQASLTTLADLWTRYDSTFGTLPKPVAKLSSSTRPLPS